MTRSYRIIRKKRGKRQMEILRKVQEDMIKRGYERLDLIEYDYGLAEVYYDEKTMIPHSRSDPKHWYETPEEIVEDLEFMFKEAKKDMKRGVSVTTTKNSIKDTNPLTPKK